MTTIIVDSRLRGEFEAVSQSAEIRDDSGNLLGYYAPVTKPDAALYARARANYDPAELARRKASTEGDKTTAELLDHLRSLESR